MAEVTKREVVASIVIVGVMFIIGLLISQKLWELKLDTDEIYQKAVQITDSEQFQYGMRTDLGNAFVYGELRAVDPVTYPEIGGEYMAVSKVKERYTKHTRTVTYTTKVDGKTKTETRLETYWTWDEVDCESVACKEAAFCDVVFPVGKIQLPGERHIETIKESARVRYVYYGVDAAFRGTIFTELKDNTISDHSRFYKDRDIETTLNDLECWDWRWLFWPVWVILMAGAVYGFVRLENEWLE